MKTIAQNTISQARHFYGSERRAFLKSFVSDFMTDLHIEVRDDSTIYWYPDNSGIMFSRKQGIMTVMQYKFGERKKLYSPLLDRTV